MGDKQIINIAVAGASGYAGMGVVRLLSKHAYVNICELGSGSYAGRPITDLYPDLSLNLEFVSEVGGENADVIFSCLPHTESATRVKNWLEITHAKVIDLGADFRLKDPSEYQKWYGVKHQYPHLLEQAILGLPEVNADKIKDARLVAVPGCYATASIIALLPAVTSGILSGHVIIDAKSGVSGAGRTLSLTAHFSEINESMHAYAIEGHRHIAEINSVLHQYNSDIKVTFVPHLIPITRGILVTCYFQSSTDVDEIQSLYYHFYKNEPFVKILSAPVDTKLCLHTNMCFIHVGKQDDTAIITAAIDNLMKGASSQAIECMNLMFGLRRTEGLDLPAWWP